MEALQLLSANLRQLFVMATNASNDFERAAVFAATEALAHQFQNAPIRADARDGVLKDVEAARSNIAAILGYGESAGEGHDVVAVGQAVVDIEHRVKLLAETKQPQALAVS